MSRMNSFNLNNLNAGVQMSNQLQNQPSNLTTNQVIQNTRTNLLNQFIGRKCTCEFYLDSDIVGTDFVVLTFTNNPDERLVCPFDELKFIKIY